MGSSTYYAEYLHHLQVADKYQRWMNALNDIRRKLQNSFSDDILRVNEKISALQDDLHDAVRHEQVFDTNTEDLHQKREKAIGYDTNLSAALGSLGNEVNRLNGLKQQEEAAAKTAYDNYQAALRAEMEAMKAAMTVTT